MLGRFWVIIGVGVMKVLGNNMCRCWERKCCDLHLSVQCTVQGHSGGC